MSREYGGKGVAFVFLYTREAHPGENFPAHRSVEQKLRHATIFREQFKIRRPILVDDLVGTGHRLYGMLPNMTYLIGRGGKVLFRADWTDPPTIEMMLQYVMTSRGRRRQGLHLAHFVRFGDIAPVLGRRRWKTMSTFSNGGASGGLGPDA
jgi:hypothetical protein